jgi:hypothetical protein
MASFSTSHEIKYSALVQIDENKADYFLCYLCAMGGLNLVLFFFSRKNFAE